MTKKKATPTTVEKSKLTAPERDTSQTLSTPDSSSSESSSESSDSESAKKKKVVETKKVSVVSEKKESESESSSSSSDSDNKTAKKTSPKKDSKKSSSSESESSSSSDSSSASDSDVAMKEVESSKTKTAAQIDKDQVQTVKKRRTSLDGSSVVTATAITTQVDDNDSQPSSWMKGGNGRPKRTINERFKRVDASKVESIADNSYVAKVRKFADPSC